MPRPLDTASGPRPMQGLATALGIVLLLVSTALVVERGGEGGAAVAAERSGGIAVPGKPQLDDAVCLTKCVATRKATPGSRVRLVGVYLSQVETIVFAGSEEPVRTRFDDRDYGTVTTTVPKGAVSGRVWVVTGQDVRSNKSPREIEVLPASRIPKEVFPVKGSVSFGSGGARFGAPRGGYSHQGQDVMAACGTRMVAARKSKVLYNQYHSAAGWYVVLKNLGTSSSFAYMHLRERSPVKLGSVVGAGQRIGRVGQTGRAYGCHLHFEFWRGPWQTGGKPVDPLPYLRSLLRK